MNFISRLMLREGRFFILFDSHAKLIVDGAPRWSTCCATTRSRRIARPGIKLIEDAEHAADRITHETV